MGGRRTPFFTDTAIPVYCLLWSKVTTGLFRGRHIGQCHTNGLSLLPQCDAAPCDPCDACDAKLWFKSIGQSLSIILLGTVDVADCRPSVIWHLKQHHEQATDFACDVLHLAKHEMQHFTKTSSLKGVSACFLGHPCHYLEMHGVAWMTNRAAAVEMREHTASWVPTFFPEDVH